ncbi:HET-domain-containing protein [Nemania sp. FL0031]|nr:HET-domain-containing protein [Nemania sp. FL0031]
MTPQIYQPLKERDEIRIIHLLPHGDDPDAPIRCRFEHVKLAERPEYEALSYTWGDQTTLFPIVVDADRSTVDVGQNCLFALRSLRQAKEARRLWIDALCINQADIDEKTNQIPIIGDVYQSASQTLIFLQYAGPDPAFRGRGAGPEMQRCWDAGSYDGDNADGDSIGEGDGNEGSQPRLDEAARREVFNLENYPWFQRAWIIQETLLSFSRTVICPPFTWSWETFIYLAPERSSVDIIRLSDDYSINRSNMGGWNHVWDGLIRERMPGDMLPMAALDYLVDTRKFQSKLYHDKVYSILSLFNPQLPVTINYSSSKEKVHESLSGALLEVGDSRFLHSTHRKSWRANWDEALNDLTGDDVHYIGMSRAMFQVRAEAQWCGIGYMDGVIRSLSFKIGDVTKISNTRIGSDKDDNEVLKRQWDDMMNELDLPVQEEETGSWPAIHVQERNQANVDWYRDWIPNSGKKQRGKFYTSSITFFRERPLFACGAEGIVGIGTQDLRVGDEIWYVCGLNVPVCALRPTPKSEASTGNDEIDEDEDIMKGIEREMVGLCFLGINNDMKTMGPMDTIFPQGSIELVWIV